MNKTTIPMTPPMAAINIGVKARMISAVLSDAGLTLSAAAETGLESRLGKDDIVIKLLLTWGECLEMDNLDIPIAIITGQDSKGC
jgi:hypothetical protein